MEVAETKSDSGVSKSGTSMAESSHEVSVEKTAHGIKESSISVAKSLEQSVEQSIQENAQQIVQKSVQQSVQEQSSRVEEQFKSSSAEIKNGNVEGSSVQNGDMNGGGETEEKEVVTETVTEGPNGEKIITRTISKVITTKAKPVVVETKAKETTTVTTVTTTKSSEGPEEVVEEVEEEEEEVVEEVVVRSPPTVTEKVEVVQPEPEEEKVTFVIKAKPKVEKVKSVEKEEPASVVEEKEEVVETKAESTTTVVVEEKEEVVAKPATPEPVAAPKPATPEPAPAPEKPKDPEPKLEDVNDEEEEASEEEEEVSEEEEEVVAPTPQKVEKENQQENISAPQKPQPEPEQPQVQQQPQSQQQPQPVKTPPQVQYVPQQQYQPPAQPTYVAKPPQQTEIRQENIKTALKEIISDIDRVIEEEEEEKTQYRQFSNNNANQYQQQTTYDHVSKYSQYKTTGRESQNYSDDRGAPKQVDLQKIFTPANDGDEILPKNSRKLFASSAFYSSGLHPTVEDQVELARRISHSLSDISNKQSKGQTMYSNRKKRSQKWVHEGEGRANDYNGYNQYYSEEIKENEYYKQPQHSAGRLPLKLVMNPKGKVQDLESLRREGFVEAPMLSPEICAEVVNALHAPRGKGAELFAKRRKKADKWIVDETTASTRSPSGVPYAPSPSSALPAFTEAGAQRVQQNIKYDQLIQEKVNQSKPRVQLVKSPWEAALETGYADNAFQEYQSNKTTSNLTEYHQDYSSTGYQAPSTGYQPPVADTIKYQKPASTLNPSQRDLAYKPSVPQGWKAPPANLPRDANYMRCAQTAIDNNTSYYSNSDHRHLSQHPDDGFSTSDEAEIVKIIEADAAASDRSYNVHNSELQINQNYLTSVSKSPELLNADARYQYLHYDNAMRELKGAILQCEKPQTIELKPIPSIDTTPMPVPVRQKTEGTSNGYQASKQETSTYREPLPTETEQQEEDYKPIPVKDLIQRLEKQTKPTMQYKLLNQTSSQSLDATEQHHFRSQEYSSAAVSQMCQPPMKTETVLPIQCNTEQNYYSSKENSMVDQYKQMPPIESISEYQNHYRSEDYSTREQSQMYTQMPSIDNNQSKQSTKVNYQNVCRGNYQKMNSMKQMSIASTQEEQTSSQAAYVSEEQQRYSHEAIIPPYSSLNQYSEVRDSNIKQIQNDYSEQQEMYSSQQQQQHQSALTEASEFSNSRYYSECISDKENICAETSYYSSQNPTLSNEQGFFTPPEIPISGYEPPATSTLPARGAYQPPAKPAASPYGSGYTGYQSSANTVSSQSKVEQHSSPAPYNSHSIPQNTTAYQYKPTVQQTQSHSIHQSGTRTNSVQKMQQKFNQPSQVTPSPTHQSHTYQPQQHHQPQQHQVQQQPISQSYGGAALTPTFGQSNKGYSQPAAAVYKPGLSSHNASPHLYAQSAPASPRVSVDFASCKNYNTAARGWTQMSDYYRPIFLDSKAKHAVQYSDF